MLETDKRQKRTDHERNILAAAKGAGITFTGKVVQTLLSLGFIIIMARLLGAEQYGMYRLAITIVVITVGVSMLGIDGGLKRFIPIARREHNEAKIWGMIRFGFGIPAAVGLALAAGIAIAADPIASGLFNSPGLVPVLRLSCLTIPVLVLANCFSSVAIGYRKVEYDAYTQDIGLEAIKLVLSLIAVLLGFGVLGAAGANVIASVLSLLILIYLVKRLLPPMRREKLSIQNRRELLHFSLPLFLSVLLNQFGRRLETLVLGVFGVIAEVGIYSALLSITAVGTLANIAMRQISTSIISELHSENRIDELRKYYQTITKWAVTFNLPVFLVTVMFSESILQLLGQEFAVGAAGLIVLAIGNMFDASTGGCGTMINYTGFSRVTFYNSMVYLISSIILDLLLIPTWGLIGAAWAGALTLIIVNTMRLVEVYVLINRILPFNISFLKPLAAAMLAGGVTYWLRQVVLVEEPIIQLFVLAPVMCALYVLVIIKLKLSHEDRLVVDRIFRRKNVKKLQEIKPETFVETHREE